MNSSDLIAETHRYFGCVFSAIQKVRFLTCDVKILFVFTSGINYSLLVMLFRVGSRRKMQMWVVQQTIVKDVTKQKIFPQNGLDIQYH